MIADMADPQEAPQDDILAMLAGFELTVEAYGTVENPPEADEGDCK